MAGRFIAVVGPSGVGKDSLIDALCQARPAIHRVRRVITRDPQAGGEAFDPVSEETFDARAMRGDFALHWRAHGLRYGIPVATKDVVRRGQDAVANLSRGMLMTAERVFGHLHVVHVTARPEVLAARLQGRGRETGAEIKGRLARKMPDLPPGLLVTEIDNSGSLEASLAIALSALYPERV